MKKFLLGILFAVVTLWILGAVIQRIESKITVIEYPMETVVEDRRVVAI